MTTELREQMDEKISNIEEAAKELAKSLLEIVDHEKAIEALQLRHQKLFNGDLTKLDWSDRLELFRLVRTFDGERSVEIAQLEGRI
jgi:hypothetical protein